MHEQIIFSLPTIDYDFTDAVNKVVALSNNHSEKQILITGQCMLSILQKAADFYKGELPVDPSQKDVVDFIKALNSNLASEKEL